MYTEWPRRECPANGVSGHLTPAPFGVLALDRLRPSDIEALLVAKRDAGLSDSTVRLIYTVCRAVLDIAVRDGLVRHNAAAAVKRPTIRRSEARYVTSDEVGRLLKTARGDRLEPLIVLMLGTGLRRGEALALHWRDVELTAGICGCAGRSHASTDGWCLTNLKTERSRRFVSLPSPVVEMLRRHKASLAAERLAALARVPWPDHEDLVFPTHIGTPADPRNALRAFEGLAERARLAGDGLHTVGIPPRGR
jgi:integrase